MSQAAKTDMDEQKKMLEENQRKTYIAIYFFMKSRMRPSYSLNLSQRGLLQTLLLDFKFNCYCDMVVSECLHIAHSMSEF